MLQYSKTLKILVLILGILGSSNSNQASASEGKGKEKTVSYTEKNVEIDGKGYSLIWQDEFEGKELDKTKWRMDGLKRNDAKHDLSMASVEDGKLSVKVKTVGGEHTTCVLSTEGLYENNGGYWEGKIKFNNPSGTWSAFWLYSQSVASVIDDIDRGGIEMDIVEHRNLDNDGGRVEDTVNHTLHWNTYDGNHHMCRAAKVDLKATEDFHVYGLLWGEKELTFFIDGKETWKYPISTKKDHFLLISTEVASKLWSGPSPDEGYDHKSMEIEYVRHYKETKRTE
jgi:beta-glucanase (GH16 family)